MEPGLYIAPAVFLSALVITFLIAYLKTEKLIDVRVGNYTVHADLADNFLKKMNGLMGRKSISEDRGMLFPFSKEGYHAFWMMNMSMPIDIIFIDSNKKVVDVWRDARPCNSTSPCNAYKPKAKAMYVLEVRANFTQRHSVKEGTKVQFSLGS
jgi:uncharacterized protein